MVEYKDLTTYSIISILLITSILGLTPNPDDTHVCLSLNMTMHCDRLSSTNKTCYPNPDTTIGKKYCSDEWRLINYTKITEEPKTIIKSDNVTIKVPLRTGGMLECNVIDGILNETCYFNNRPTYRSEFE